MVSTIDGILIAINYENFHKWAMYPIILPMAQYCARVRCQNFPCVRSASAVCEASTSWIKVSIKLEIICNKDKD